MAAEPAAIRGMMATCGIPNGNTPNDNAAQRFQAHVGITSFEDLWGLNAKELASSIKEYNRRYAEIPGVGIGTIPAKKLRALVYWARDRHSQQLPIDAASWTNAALRTAISQMEIESIERENEATSDIKPTTIEIGLGWYEWEKGFVNVLATRRGVQGKLDYVVRRDKGPDWDVVNDAVDDDERRRYRLLLQGPEYISDNKSVFHILQSVTLGTEAYAHVQKHEASQDGRGAMADLRSFYEGEGEKTKRKAEAEKRLDKSSGLHYRGDENKFPFSKYATELKRVYQTLEECGIPHVQSQMVNRLHDGIRCTNNVIQIAMINMKDQYKDDFEGAINYMSAKVTDVFGSGSAYASAAKRRRINEARTDSSRGGHSYGQGNSGRGARYGRGGGRGRGRGGRSNGGRGRGGNTGGGSSSRLQYNGVDLSDPTRRFTEQEMNDLGAEGQAIMYQLRRARQDTGRGGGRGTGRGGREVREVNREATGDTGSEPSTITPGSGDSSGGGRGSGSEGGTSGFGRGAYARRPR